jgi:hypothetical protein
MILAQKAKKESLRSGAVVVDKETWDTDLYRLLGELDLDAQDPAYR